VELIYPQGEQDWFNDVVDHKAYLPPRVAWQKQTYDLMIEVCWSLLPEERQKQKTIYFAHYPPIFHDMESCVYNANMTKRDFKNLYAIWTYDMYSKQDVEYFEFLSGVPVEQVPYLWDPTPLDLFIEKEKLPSWAASATHAESIVPADHPKSMSWCLRVFESNFSNSSHCVIPLNIISEIRKTVEPVRFTAHNADTTVNNEFMKNNILKNLLLPDAPSTMIPRVRLPDTRKEKTLIIAHQRFRPMKSFLLDALYLGTPMIHNNKILKGLGIAPYYYELNQIRDAVELYKQVRDDYVGSRGFFASGSEKVRQDILRKTFSPYALSTKFMKLLQTTPTLSRPLPKPILVKKEDHLRVAFATMWDQFQPNDNFFMYLLKWVGKLNNINVVLDEVNPNVVFWGPLSQGSERKWPDAKKVYFTGENARPTPANNTFLNLGFDYQQNQKSSYIRLPLWVLEINWWGADVKRMVNPLPVSVTDATTAVKDRGNRDFCAFVATNPNNPTRNAVFDTLNKWRPVASGGRLYCNLPNGPIPGGMGGGGGELAKVEFYKKYNFVLAMENSSNPGYVTEKIFHAKVAGCVPIYWGDVNVDRDFDANGYVEITKSKNLDDVLERVKVVADDKDAIEKMAAIPAVTPYKRKWCEKTMAYVAQQIFYQITGKQVIVNDEDWAKAESFGKTFTALPQPQSKEPVLLSKDRVFVTAANAKFAEAAVNAIRSLKAVEPTVKAVVFIWPDVSDEVQAILRKVGADEVRLLPIASVSRWADFWNPEHYAWKLWVHKIMLDEVADNTSILYCDSGTIVVSPLTNLWAQIAKQGILAINDPTQQNKRWCHPTFCKNMNVTQEELDSNQLWAGCFGYRKGAYDAIANEALRIAETERETIVGNKWSMYSATCMGHRHDQSILSILTHRARVPRITLNDVYCDISHRAAEQFGAPLYVHRGNYKYLEPIVEGIDEGYLINLLRRKDRLDKFKETHSNLKNKVYVYPAVDGRTLTMTPELAHCFRNNDFKWKKAVMGCALSHLRIWEKLANDTMAKRYLIMEDDVKFQQNWLATWYSMVPHIPQDADVIYLGGVLPPNKDALQYVVDRVNPYFAKVAKNTLTSPHPRRYFHFCNYSYILTQAGARKLVQLVKERGIFTSGDHMIVNHGDDFLNIYFTTPLLATCFQEDDPVYQKSEFNNFNRVDNFDSDLWNNTDCFTEAEVAAKQNDVPANIDMTPPTLEIKEIQKEDNITVWNRLLKEIALKKLDKKTLDDVFKIWDTMGDVEFLKNFGWFRIFEQFIVSKNPTLLEKREQILSYAEGQTGNRKVIFKEVLKVLQNDVGPAKPAIALYNIPPTNKQVIYHMKEIDPTTFLENDWLSYIFLKPIQWVPIEDTIDLSGKTILYQKIPHMPGHVQTTFRNIIAKLKEKSQTAVLLHLSDEFANDDISIYSECVFSKIIRNYWRPDLPSTSTQLPLGYTNGRSNYAYDSSPTFKDRPYLWSFAGSMNRPGRQDAIANLQTTGNFQCFGKETWESPYPQDGPAYIDCLRKSKFVPCFAGSAALESYRLYEALEHGAIPIYVSTQYDEYKEMYGQTPLLGFPSWEKAAQTLPLLAQKHEVMEKHRKACQTWWEEKKKSLRETLKPTA
jgi:hypothetical protein